jgi:Holliday junction resolvase-like predicted endonuclease
MKMKKLLQIEVQYGKKKIMAGKLYSIKEQKQYKYDKKYYGK